jgi:putative iron-dependent peroxidase
MIEESAQPGILSPVPVVARSLTFSVVPEADVAASLHRLSVEFPAGRDIVGIGQPTLLALNAEVPGLRTFPAFSGPGCSVPSTQQALWIRLCGHDRGIVFDAARRVTELLRGAFQPVELLDTFIYQGGRDLTRYEDGTANPKDEEAVRAAFVADAGGLEGSSFVAVQKWVHDLDRFASFSPKRRDEVIGRSAETNEELSEAPPFAHVKRSEQESYDPPAFMLRRSMPWADGDQQGLEFVAFGESLDRFERVMRRMTGLDDRVVDGLFLFSRPVTGGYYWCPPVVGGKLNLAGLERRIEPARS